MPDIAGSYSQQISEVRIAGPTVFKAFNNLVVTGEQTIWTPATGKKFRLMGYVITQGVATGNITFKDNTGGSTILVVPAQTLGVAQQSPLIGAGFVSAAINNVLSAIGVATETISGYVFGTEE